MNGILYFSSTGNCLYVAEKLQQEIGGQIKFIPNYSGSGDEFEKLIIVTPIHSFGLPIPVYNLLPKLSKKKAIIVIQTYGGASLGADYLFYTYATAKCGLNVVAMYKVKMVENFTLALHFPKSYEKKILKKSVIQVEKIIDKIKKCEYFLPEKRRTKEKTYLKGKDNFYEICTNFSTNSNCNKCGKCIKICPAKNISLENGKITFGKCGIACLSCYHRCPQKAIIYKNKNKKYRYVNPFVNPENIGKDL